MAMIRKGCVECGKTGWHNPTQKDKQEGHRCTFCGFPLGTGPKRDKNAATHAAQVAKARKGG